MPNTPGSRRWVVWCLGLYVLFAACVALLPVSYADIVHGIARALSAVPGMDSIGSGWIEFAANIVLFVPLGFLLTLLFRNPWVGAIIGLVISAGFEIAQILVPDRQPTVRDVISNTLGAALGALIAWLVVRHRRLRARSSGRS
jgi:VanZ family protein